MDDARLDYSVWGMRPTGYHLTNVLLHAANAVLVYLLALRLFRLAERTRAAASAPRGSGRRHRAGFALHPLRVESVAWVTERRDVLSLLFYLSTVLAYLRSRTDGGDAGTGCQSRCSRARCCRRRRR